MEERQCEKHQTKTLALTEEGMRRTALWSRVLSGCGLSGKFNPIFVMERVIPAFDNSFNYQIVEKRDWKLGETLPAYYNPAENVIVMRSDVYEGALEGNAMDVITATHEVAHCIQSITMRFLRAMNCVEFKTKLCEQDSEEMKSHEIQTDRIASLLLSPERLSEGKSDEEIMQEYFIGPMFQFICGLLKLAANKVIETLAESGQFKEKEVEACAV